MKGAGAKTPDPDWNRGRGGRSTAVSRQNSPPRETPPCNPVPTRTRRGSRVARQHSYDDEVKKPTNSTTENGLGLPTPMPRRASAYDVFAVPGLSTVTPASGINRRASFRMAPESNSPPSPEDTIPSLAPPEEDRRTRRRGSHL